MAENRQREGKDNLINPLKRMYSIIQAVYFLC